MIALKTSPLFFGHEIFLVFHLFLLFRINSMTYNLYRQFNVRKVLHIIYFFCYCIAFVNCPWKKKLNLVAFYHINFVLCDTLSGYLERPNNSDSNISHCCLWRHVYILVALVCNSCAELTELILNVQKYSDKHDKRLWSQLTIIQS